MNHQRELKRYLSSENVTRELEDFYELIDLDFSYSVFDFLQQICYFLLFNVDLLRSRLHFQLSQLTWFFSEQCAFAQFLVEPLFVWALSRITLHPHKRVAIYEREYSRVSRQ